MTLSFCSPANDGGEDEKHDHPSALAADTVPAIFGEALEKFKQQALFFDRSQPCEAETVSEFNRYLEKQDPFAEYLQPETYKQYKSAQASQYVGVGMEIEKEETGDVACFPFVGSPAWENGIRNGDILLAIDGESISGRSIYALSSQLMGTAGTKVKLSVFNESGGKRSLTLTRALIRSSSVRFESMGSIATIRINSFDMSTRRELKYILSQHPDLSPLVLDLRDNPGGDLYKCIDSAMLFLSTDVPIVTVETRTGRQTYTSTTPAYARAAEIYIWQNENTASAAEVFIAALTQNLRAQSIGKKTYGKGITQEMFALGNGSAIIFTNGYLLTPDNAPYHRRGLLPTHPLDGNPPTTADYLQTTRNAIKARRPQKTTVDGS
ncbi:S41 family peptidase [Desulfosarcina ovata]|uniref:S41 family peptidase n=1 Tax=Desulfosarcina ovata TaxID=83564 RepID=UPI001E552348|nr:S41 family peptidase [Desulfosarcina ovata]